MRGLRLLQKHGVEYNIVVTVNRNNADYPLEVYRFLRDEADTEWIQFIPVIERITEDGLTIYQQGSTVSERSVCPEQFGRFLIRVFDEWVMNDVGSIYVQTFEATLRNWIWRNASPRPSSGMCVFEPTCGFGLALEHNGDLYSCDHFVEPDYLLGNIQDEHMIDLVSCDRQVKFGRDKLDALPRYCLECEVRFACHGECPKNRFITSPPGEATPDGEPGLNYLCAGWKAYFHRVDKPMKILATLLRTNRPALDVMEILAEDKEVMEREFSKADQGQPCPCGSGLEFRACHGWVRSSRGRRRRKKLEPHAKPRPKVTAVSENR